jgi:hypothetical protein
MNNLPGKNNNDQKNPLWEDILKFSKNKYILAALLILISLTGIIIPIIPGIFLFIIAVALLRKGWMANIRNRIRLWKIK